MVPLKLDLHSLIVFYQVASAGSVTAAADAMCLTQPTVTYHIRSLERNTGVRLLDIKRQKVSLTQAGKGLLVYASHIYHQMADAEQYIENLKETSFRVGVSTTFSNCLIPVVARLKKQHPRVKLIIRNAPSDEVREDVLNSEVDLGIVVGTDARDPKLKTITLSRSERLVLVAAPQNPITRRKHLNLLNICGHPLVLGPETSATRQMILRRLRAGGCGAPTPIIVEVNNSDWGMNLVENGQGVGLHHICSVQKAIEEGRLKALPLSGELRVRADALLRADAPEHPITTTFITMITQTLKQGDREPQTAASVA
jgi:DNA-binding transcriptional LysR family regulator